MAKFKYNAGDTIGPHNILILERMSKVNQDYILKVECNNCKQSYLAKLDYLQRGLHKVCPDCKAKQFNHNFKDLTGQKFGKLTAIKPLKDSKKKRAMWLCECDCGNMCIASSKVLLHNEKKSCGCARRENIAGQKFGKLIAIEPTDERDKRSNGASVIWKCKCDCGNIIYANVHSLKRGNTSSCGCLTSKGEEKLQKYLTQLNVKYNTQQIFNDCINPKTNAKLKFDFYLPDYNCCIEYDGRQHFKYDKNSTWNTKEHLIDLQYRDSIKNSYCKNNKISLIRIPYWDYSKLSIQYLNNLLLKNSPLYLIHYLDTSNFQYLDNNFSSGIEIIPDSYKRIIFI